MGVVASKRVRSTIVPILILEKLAPMALSLSILKQSWQKLELTIASCIICNHGSSWDLSRESPSGGSDW